MHTCTYIFLHVTLKYSTKIFPLFIAAAEGSALASHIYDELKSKKQDKVQLKLLDFEK